MGWLNNLLNKVAGAAPTDWTLVEDLQDPGFDISGKPIIPDECYIELYVESLRLEKARRFGTNFNGIIYSYTSLARHGSSRAELTAATKPQNLAGLDAGNLDRVITVSKRIMSAVPWRGDPLGLELGLFSVKSGNLLTPLVDYVVKISDKAGISGPFKIDQISPLITEGLDLLAGQTTDTAIELAIDTDLSLAKSKIFALIALAKGQLSLNRLSIDKTDRKLLLDNVALEAGYCVFSIRSTDRNVDWGAIQPLREAYGGFTDAVIAGKHRDAEDAVAVFNRQVTISPDLISADKNMLKKAVRAELQEAFPGGGQAAAPNTIKEKFGTREFADLNLYG